MCEPTTILMGVGMGLQVVGGLQAASAAKAEGEAKRQAGVFNRQSLKNAAIVARANAGRAGERGREKVTDIAEQGLRLSGRQLTSLAANGVVVNDGSGIDLQADLARTVRRNIARTRQQTVDEQAGLIAQAGDLEQQGFIAELTGVQDAVAGQRRAQTLITQTTGRVASQWYQNSLEGTSDTGVIADILFLGNTGSRSRVPFESSDEKPKG